MSDLKVDYYALEDSEKTLHGLKGEFDKLESNVSNSTNVWSHDRVRDAMHEFAGNMDYNRKKLSQKLEDCEQKTAQTLKAFRESDEELAKKFDKERL